MIATNEDPGVKCKSTIGRSAIIATNKGPGSYL